MMETVSASETSVNIYRTTWCDISEDSHLHIRRRVNLKTQISFLIAKRHRCNYYFVYKKFNKH
jgi:hypothetical protein